MDFNFSFFIDLFKDIFSSIVNLISGIFSIGGLIRENVGGFTSFLSFSVEVIPVEYWTALSICFIVLIVGIVVRYLGG